MLVGWCRSNRIECEPSPSVRVEEARATKLTWCLNICEKGYTGATRNMWILRWNGNYRDLEYRAM